MHLIYRKQETAKIAMQMAMPVPQVSRPLWKTSLYFASMVGILVFANWAKGDGGHKNPLYDFIFEFKWFIVLALLVFFSIMLISWFNRKERTEWVGATWDFAWMILPLLLAGVLISGFLLGKPGSGNEGVIPAAWVNKAVGGNSVWSNLFASVAGAFMYFATLTEVPILQGLMGAGMGKGPALALLLAGPALSLPSMLVLRSIMGTQKTVVYVTLVIVMATISGIIFGRI